MKRLLLTLCLCVAASAMAEEICIENKSSSAVQLNVRVEPGTTQATHFFFQGEKLCTDLAENELLIARVEEYGGGLPFCQLVLSSMDVRTVTLRGDYPFIHCQLE